MKQKEPSDFDTFEDLIRKHYVQLWNSTRGYVRKRGGSEELAKDILHEAFIRLCEKGEVVKSTEFTAYAFGFIRNVAREMLRSRQRENLKIERVDDNEGWKLARLTESEYQSERFDTEDQVLVMQYIDDIGKDCKEMLITYYVHGHSNKELAEEYNTSESYIKVKKNRCMKQLRDKFDH